MDQTMNDLFTPLKKDLENSLGFTITTEVVLGLLLDRQYNLSFVTNMGTIPAQYENGENPLFFYRDRLAEKCKELDLDPDTTAFMLVDVMSSLFADMRSKQMVRTCFAHMIPMGVRFNDGMAWVSGKHIKSLEVSTVDNATILDVTVNTQIPLHFKFGGDTTDPYYQTVIYNILELVNAAVEKNNRRNKPPIKDNFYVPHPTAVLRH